MVPGAFAQSNRGARAAPTEEGGEALGDLPHPVGEAVGVRHARVLAQGNGPQGPFQDEGVLEAVQDLEAPLRLHGLALRPHEDHHRHPGPGVLALVNGQGSEAGQGPP